MRCSRIRAQSASRRLLSRPVPSGGDHIAVLSAPATSTALSEGESGGPRWAPTRYAELLWTEVPARIQEPIVLGRLTGRRIGRPLTDADVDRGLEAVELIQRPDASRSVYRRGAGSAVADARRASAARVELIGDPWGYRVAVPWLRRTRGRGQVQCRRHALPYELDLLRRCLVGLGVRADGADILRRRDGGGSRGVIHDQTAAGQPAPEDRLRDGRVRSPEARGASEAAQDAHHVSLIAHPLPVAARRRARVVVGVRARRAVRGEHVRLHAHA